MWTTLEPWHLSQLQRMATHDPSRVEALMNHLFNVQPTLLIDLAVSAVDQEQLSVAQCAAITGLSEEQVESQLVSWRNRAVDSEGLVVLDEKQVARLAEGQVAVWEVVRVFRQKGSLSALADDFRSLSLRELMAALAYAEKNPKEIEDQIARYEDMLQKRRAEYPFVR